MTEFIHKAIIDLFSFLAGTDRSNLVEIRNRDENYPYPYEQTTFWKNTRVRWSPMAKSVDSIKKDDLALYFASSGYYRFVDSLPSLSQRSLSVISVVNVKRIVQVQTMRLHSIKKPRN